MTALLTDGEIDRAAINHAYNHAPAAHQYNVRKAFTTGARFARDHYEAAMQRERKVRLDLADVLETAKAWLSTDASLHLIRKINAALAAAKEIE